MLQIKNIHKEYRTGPLVQKALDDVSLNLRDNEFVAILGPSGSGKTTLLNIIGGLDRYDSGDLIINGISTKKYKDRDWDSYRNHTIGFVFQSYNLIPHQTILANVELALTISGIGKKQRTQKAMDALKKVGLGEQVHKRPNQLSGGQMQRVAIARALVNDPDILLADEPTGALDSDTSVQVMDLLKEVARDRLVVMVTHNPELAQDYATRIVTVKDGHILSDTDPFDIDEALMSPPEHKNMGRAAMSFLTALSLSFNNLRTKKARTLLTAFAGSIGIIGIALILALSTGVNDYIRQMEEDTLSEYPLQIQSSGLDISSMLVGMGGGSGNDEEKSEDKVHVISMVTNMFSTMNSNDLKSLKAYLDSGKSDIEQYTKAVEYAYNVTPQIYRETKDSVRQVHPDQSFSAMGLGASTSAGSVMSSMMSTNVFYKMPDNTDLYESQYDVKAGRWPKNYNECVLVLTSNGGMSDFLLYTLGLRDAVELDDMVQSFIKDETVQTPDNIQDYDYDEILGRKFKLVNSADYYEYDSQYKVWKDKIGDKDYMKKLVANGEDMTIVGIVQPAKGSNAASLTAGINYPASLVTYVVENAAESEIVKQQLADSKTNVFTGEAFGVAQDSDDFDMNSLVTIDEDALADAFAFDQSGMDSAFAGSFDLSGAFGNAASGIDLSGMMNLDDISVDLPQMPAISMKDMLGSVKITVSQKQLQTLAESMFEGYQLYVKTHPEADYSGLASDFAAYLGTDAAKQIIYANIKEIIEANGGVEISAELLQQMVTEVMSGYQAYITKMGYTDPDKFGEYLMEYLQTAEAQEILKRWADKLFMNMDDFTITDEQLEKMASELATGYLTYATKQGLPDPSKMGDYFLDYLASSDGQARLTEGVTGMIDTSELEAQVASSIQSYMESVMQSYGNVISQAVETQITSVIQQMMTQLGNSMSSAMAQAMTSVGDSLASVMNVDGEAFAKAFQMNMSGDELMELLMSMGSSASTTYESNLQTLGYAEFDNPSGINIYPKDFTSKEHVIDILDAYNTRMENEGKSEQVISYTDVVGTLMSSVTDIVDIVSYVLIAFVAISLVVSSIMIGVITYISVLERKKEIGILRAIGASKKNISQVFNAETFIIGLCSGILGIGLTLLILIPGNMVIHYIAEQHNVTMSAVLPVIPAIVLVVLCIVLTMLGGLIPSKKAAKSDPVTALRTD